MLTIRPKPCSAMAAPNTWQPKKMLFTFVVRTLVKASSVRVIRSAACVTAALLTTIVGVPHTCRQVARPSSKPALPLTSSLVPRAVEPSGDSSAARASTVSVSMSASRTFRPSACSFRAMKAPSPPAAPVTTAIPGRVLVDWEFISTSQQVARGADRVLAVDEPDDLERDLVPVLVQGDRVGQLGAGGEELVALVRAEDLGRPEGDRRVADVLHGEPRDDANGPGGGHGRRRVSLHHPLDPQVPHAFVVVDHVQTCLEVVGVWIDVDHVTGIVRVHPLPGLVVLGVQHLGLFPDELDGSEDTGIRQGNRHDSLSHCSSSSSTSHRPHACPSRRSRARWASLPRSCTRVPRPG